MQKLIVSFLLSIFSFTALAGNIHLSLGDSITLGSNTVSCNDSQSGNQSYWVCTLRAAGSAFVGKSETKDSAMAEAYNECDSRVRYPLCKENWGGKYTCEEAN